MVTILDGCMPCKAAYGVYIIYVILGADLCFTPPFLLGHLLLTEDILKEKLSDQLAITYQN